MVDITDRGDFLDPVRCGGQIVESVLTVRICRRGCNQSAGLGPQINGRSDLKLLARVEQVVLIRIDECGSLQETPGKQIPCFQMFNPEPPL